MTTGRFQASEFHWQLSGDELDGMTGVSRPFSVTGDGRERAFILPITIISNLVAGILREFVSVQSDLIIIRNGMSILGSRDRVRRIILTGGIMNRLTWLFGLLLPLSISFSVWGQTPWPDYMPSLKPGKTNSAVAAPLWPANTNVESPASDISPERAKWSGRWTGWACRNKTCDTKLAVEKVTAQGVSIIYAIASTNIAPDIGRYQAEFVGEELHARFESGRKVIYRMRPDGALDFLSLSPAGQYEIAGILAKEP